MIDVKIYTLYSPIKVVYCGDNVRCFDKSQQHNWQISGEVTKPGIDPIFCPFIHHSISSTTTMSSIYSRSHILSHTLLLLCMVSLTSPFIFNSLTLPTMSPTMSASEASTSISSNQHGHGQHGYGQHGHRRNANYNLLHLMVF